MDEENLFGCFLVFFVFGVLLLAYILISALVFHQM